VTRKKEIARDKVLDAAEAVILESGGRNFTLVRIIYVWIEPVINDLAWQDIDISSLHRAQFNLSTSAMCNVNCGSGMARRPARLLIAERTKGKAQ
jgi:hypothetical protein